MIGQDDTYETLLAAIESDNLGEVDRLIKIDAIRKEAIAALDEPRKTDVLNFAVGLGHTNILKRLLEDKEIRSKCSSPLKGYENALVYAIKRMMPSDLESINILLTPFLEHIPNIPYEAYFSPPLYEAMVSGDLAILNRLLAFKEFEDIFLNKEYAKGMFESFEGSSPSLEIMNRLLAFPFVKEEPLSVTMIENQILQNAEQPDEQPLVTAALQAIVKGYANLFNFLIENPVVKENIAINDNFALRHAIRLRDREMVTKLMSCDSVREMIASSPQFINVFLGTADDPDFMRFLLGFPSIRSYVQPAEAARPGQAPQRPSASGELRDIAGFSESAMSARSEEQKTQFSILNERYGSQIPDEEDSKVIASHVDSLKNLLRKKFEENPPIYRGMKLPFEVIKFIDGKAVWSDEFSNLLKMAEENAIKMSKTAEEGRGELLQLYYSNPYHSVYRYLFSNEAHPNLFSSEGAKYMLPMNAPTGFGKSAWPDIQPTERRNMAMIWLAILDGSKPLSPMFPTREDLIEEFIKTLALMARAHNWDKYRQKTNKEGQLAWKNEAGKEIYSNTPEPGWTKVEEQYDDKEGDNPTCQFNIQSVSQFLTALLQVAELNKDTISERFRESLVSGSAGEPTLFNRIQELDKESLERLNRYISDIVAGDEPSDKDTEFYHETLKLDQKLVKNFVNQCKTYWTPERISSGEARWAGKTFANWEVAIKAMVEEAPTTYMIEIQKRIEARLKELENKERKEKEVKEKEGERWQERPAFLRQVSLKHDEEPEPKAPSSEDSSKPKHNKPG